MHLRTSGQLLLHLLPCVGSLLDLQKGNAVSQGWGTYGFLDRKCRRTILWGCTYLELKTCFRKEIAWFACSIADQDPDWLAGRYGGLRMGNDNSSSNRRMSNISLPFLQPLNLWDLCMKELNLSSVCSPTSVFVQSELDCSKRTIVEFVHFV